MNEERNKHVGNKLAGVHGMSHLSDCNERIPFTETFLSTLATRQGSLLWNLVETVLYDRSSLSY